MLLIHFDPQQSPLKPIPLGDFLHTLRETYTVYHQFLRLPLSAEDSSGKTFDRDTLNKYTIAHSPLPAYLDMLLLDGLDEIPFWKWIQRYLIKPFLSQSEPATGIRVIVASQAPIFWHFWELRETTRLNELPTFSEQETAAFLQHNFASYQELATPLYQLTKGYPLAIHTAVTLIEQTGARAMPAPSTSQATSLGLDPQLLQKLQAVPELLWLGMLRTKNARSRLVMLEAAQPTDRRWREKRGFNPDLEAVLQRISQLGLRLPLSPDLRDNLRQYQRTTQPERYRAVWTALANDYAEQCQRTPYPQLERGILNEWLYASVQLDDQSLAEDLLMQLELLAGHPQSVLYVQDDRELQALVRNSRHAATLCAYLPDVADQQPDSYAALIAVAQQLLPTESQRQAYCEQLYSRFHRVFESHPMSKHALADFLQAALAAQDQDGSPPEGAQAEPSFSLESLRQQIGPKYKPGQVNEIVPTLNSRGFLLYHPQQRRFSLNPVLPPIIRLHHAFTSSAKEG